MDIQFIDPVPDILQEVKAVTGKEIKFIQKEALPTFATLKMARKDMPSHLIFYKKEHDKIINHLIVHECGHLFRTFRCPENQRLIPYSDTPMKSYAMRQMENEVLSLTNFLSEDHIFHIIDGTIRQVTNLPPDIMIEKWIFDSFPELRSLQLESLKKQHEEALSGLSDEIQKIIPATVVFASNVMNYAFFRILGFHIGQNFVRPYNSTPYINKGKALASMTEKGYADSHEGDNLMIDKWASFLDINGWFKWRGFEDIPTDYEQSV